MKACSLRALSGVHCVFVCVSDTKIERESKHGVFGWVGRCVFAQIGYCKLVFVRGTKKKSLLH